MLALPTSCFGPGQWLSNIEIWVEKFKHIKLEVM